MAKGLSSVTSWMQRMGRNAKALPFDLRLTDPLRSRDLRIGIVGSSRSGKSVLLTSILDHLKNYDPEMLSFRRGLQLKRFSRIDTGDEDPSIPAFPYEAFRSQLSQEGSWPSKTKAAYRFDCSIRVDDGLKFWPRTLRLHWLDFPGERLADLPMGGRSYEAWSDQLWESLEHCPRQQEAIARFRHLARQPDVSRESLSDGYKRLLAALAAVFRPLVTPSTFLLCPQGSQPARGAAVEELVRDRLIGVDRGSPVVPLDRQMRAELPPLAQQFAGNYERYVAEIADPLFRQLSRCDRILVPVNIPEILASGPDALNDTSDLIARFLDSSLPSEKLPLRISGYLRNHLVAPVLKDSWRPGGIRRVAFVATQADRVLAPDCNRLLHLLNQLVRVPVRNASSTLKYATFTCSAVCAASTVDEDLVGLLKPSIAGSDEREQFAVSRLPREWPDNWDPDAFIFPEVYPRFSPIRNRPPRQEGLADILEYLLFQ